MKKLLLILLMVTLHFTLSVAQSVTRTQHRAAVTTDAVTTGNMTIRKPDYICISTDGGREQLIMDGTKFTMTIGGRNILQTRKRTCSLTPSTRYSRLLSTDNLFLLPTN